MNDINNAYVLFFHFKYGQLSDNKNHQMFEMFQNKIEAVMNHRLKKKIILTQKS